MPQQLLVQWCERCGAVGCAGTLREAGALQIHCPSCTSGASLRLLRVRVAGALS